MFVNTRDVIGELALVDSIIDGSVTEYRDNMVSVLGQNIFINCGYLTTVDCPNINRIISNAFNKCTTLSTLILRGSALVSLDSTSAFTRTPIASGTGYIYVPGALVNTYKAATNWSTYVNQFRALEDYTVDGTVSGDLDETKI